MLLSLSCLGQAESLCSDVFSDGHLNARIIEYYESLQKDAGWFRSHLLFKSQSMVFSKFSQIIETPDVRKAVSSGEFGNVLSSLIYHPRKALSIEQIRVLNSKPVYRHVVKVLLQLIALTEWNARVVQRAFHYARGQEVVPGSSVRDAISIKTKKFISDIYHSLIPSSEVIGQGEASAGVSAKDAISWAARGMYNGPLRYLLTFVPLPKKLDSIGRIFENQLKNPNYILSEQEVALLKSSNSYDAYLTNQRFQNNSKNWQALRRFAGRAFVTAFAAHLVVVANWSMHLTKPESVRPIDHFLDRQEYRLQSNQVRIYNESVPFPHMAIEIDGKVYSYGQTHLEVKTAREYLLIEKIRAKAIEKAGVQRPAEDGSVNIGKVFQLTGLDQLPRSVQMVTLNLNSLQKDQLKRRLEMSTFSRYQNHTFAMDCATMVAKALSDSTDIPIPFFEHMPVPIDASPSVMMMYFGLLKSMGIKNSDGNQLVGDVGQVAIDRPNEIRMHQLRNLYINSMESRLFLTFFHWNVGIRGYVNVRYGVDQFQFLEPEVRQSLSLQKVKEVNELIDATSDEILAHQYNVLLAEAKKLGRVSAPMRDQAWIQSASELLQVVNVNLGHETQEARKTFDSPDTSFQDVLYSGFKIDLLNRLKIQIEMTIKGGEPKLISSNPYFVLDQIIKEASSTHAGGK